MLSHYCIATAGLVGYSAGRAPATSRVYATGREVCAQSLSACPSRQPWYFAASRRRIKRCVRVTRQHDCRRRGVHDAPQFHGDGGIPGEVAHPIGVPSAARHHRHSRGVPRIECEPDLDRVRGTRGVAHGGEVCEGQIPIPGRVGHRMHLALLLMIAAVIRGALAGPVY